MSPWFKLPHLSAGFITVLVGYTSSAVIVFQAAAAAGATPGQLASWLWALGLGMGLTCIGLSWCYRVPVLTAWSTPGAALLVTALVGVPMGEAVAAFLLSSALILACALTGWAERLQRHLPPALAAAMLAGVLLRFGLDLFIAAARAPWLVGGMIATFLLVRIRLPRYAVPLALLVGLLLAVAGGLVQGDQLRWSLAQPEWVTPQFNMATLVGVGLPLFVVTMASQNIPGVAVLHAHGYRPPVSPLLATTGVVGLLLAPFGGFAFNLAAITAAICMQPDVDPEPAERYRAAIWAGGFYLLLGIMGAAVSGLFTALPRELVMAIAGLALLGTIGNSLVATVGEEQTREAALLTFLITASGIAPFGIGSAFWGLLAGLLLLRLPR